VSSRTLTVAIEVSDGNPERCGAECPCRRGQYCDLFVLLGYPREQCRIGIGYRCDPCREAEENGKESKGGA